MPEILEIEMYRRAAETVVGRTIDTVDAPDDWYLKRTVEAEVVAAVAGSKVRSFDRIGKLLLMNLDENVLGLRFGMTGRLIIDDEATIEKLEYSSQRLDPSWNRFSLHFSNAGSLVMNDPRRLGGVELNPDVSALGIDAWTLQASDLFERSRKRRVAVKALLLNQKVVAGLGNLLVDELLWRVGVDPNRAASSLSVDECEILAETCRALLPELYDRGGSHTGDLFEERGPQGRCPRDGAELRRAEIGGRTTWWCPQHQS